CWALYDAHQKGLDQVARSDHMRRQFRSEAIPHLIDYWDNSDDYQKIVLTALAMLERKSGEREFSLAEVSTLFARAEPSVERLEKRGLLVSGAGGYRLFSPMFSPWLVRQVTAQLGEQQGYDEWLAQHGRSLEQFAEARGSGLKEILPKIHG